MNSAVVEMFGRDRKGLETSPTTCSWSPGAAASAAASVRAIAAYSEAPREGAVGAQTSRCGARNRPLLGSFHALSRRTATPSRRAIARNDTTIARYSGRASGRGARALTFGFEGSHPPAARAAQGGVE